MSRKLTTEEFIQKARTIYGDIYDYSKVNYINNCTKVIIICKEHGEFLQIPILHLFQGGCRLCGINQRATKRRKNIISFIDKSILIHNNKYDYSLIQYKNTNTKIKIICKKHGLFEQTPHSHLRGRGCPKCNSSKGEEIIHFYLKEHKLNFIQQKRFHECKGIRNSLPFDFYLPEHNTCIEFDGKQHFEPVLRWGGVKRFNETQITDKIKNEYCFKSNIRLIRISYNQINDVEQLLSSFL